MEFVNMFDPMTLSDAYQRALAFEKQNRRVGSSSSFAITGASGFGNVVFCFSPNQANAGGGNIGPVPKETGSSGLKCFNCGESGHRQSLCKKAGKRQLLANLEDDNDEVFYGDYEAGSVYDEEPEYEEEYVSRDVGVNLLVRRSCLTPKANGDDWLKHNINQSTCTILGKVYTFVCDSGSCDNLIAEEAVQKLGLKTKNHPKLYKLQWLRKGGEVTVFKRVHVPFSIGTTDKDNVWYDVVPMDACYLLLGRPWEYDRAITHNGRTNTYSFLFRGVKITLMPNKPKEVVNKPTGTLLTLSQIEDELEMGDDIFVLIGKKVAEDSEILEVMIPLHEEFTVVFPDELPDGLSPLCDIQHHIDLEPGQVINKITVRYRFPIPRLDDLLDQISGTTIFTKLDLKSEYYQIHLRPGDEWNTAFKTREGLYEWESHLCRRRKLAFQVVKEKLTTAPILVNVPGLDVIRDMVTVDPYFLVVLQGVQSEILFCMMVSYSKGISFVFLIQVFACKLLRSFMVKGMLVVIALYSWDVYRLHGLPSSILFYQETRILSHFWRSLWKMVNTQLNFSSAYHPQTDGQTKVVNRSFGSLLRCLVGDHVKEWDQKFFQVDFAHNHAVNRSIGFSLFQVVYSAQPCRPLDLMTPQVSRFVPNKVQDFVEGLHDVHKVIRDNLVRANLKYKQDADQKRRHVDFEVGDFVWDVLTKDHFPIGE
nr:hypothetical protein [Tanacetum cinerariifolium]